MHVENVIVGFPIVREEFLLAYDHEDWAVNESRKTWWTKERYLPAILKEIGFVKSTSEVRRNKPEYDIFLNNLDCFWIKWGKKKIYIIVGKDGVIDESES